LGRSRWRVHVDEHGARVNEDHAGVGGGYESVGRPHEKLDAAGGHASGIAKIPVQHVNNSPGRLKVLVKGKHGSFTPPSGASVFDVATVLDPTVASTSQCAQDFVSCLSLPANKPCD
jgi:hypothetical protein